MFHKQSAKSTTADELFEVINEDSFNMKYDGNIASVVHSWFCCKVSERCKGLIRHEFCLKSWVSSVTHVVLFRESCICKCLSIALNCTLNDETKMGKSNKTQALRVHLASAFSEAQDQSTTLFFIPKCVGIQSKKVKNVWVAITILHKWISPCWFVERYS